MSTVSFRVVGLESTGRRRTTGKLLRVQSYRRVAYVISQSFRRRRVWTDSAVFPLDSFFIEGSVSLSLQLPSAHLSCS